MTLGGVREADAGRGGEETTGGADCGNRLLLPWRLGGGAPLEYRDAANAGYEATVGDAAAFEFG